jgi:hypothetical protein
MNRRAGALLVLLAACGSSSSDPNPPRLWYDLAGPEVAGKVQLVPFQPAPF